jgi:hypothetical protein
MFDINAPIERQFTRDGRKVLAIFDSGLGVDYPISAWVENNPESNAYMHCGRCNKYGESNADLISRSVQLPLIVSYLNFHVNGVARCFTDFGLALEKQGNAIAIAKLTFDPNNGESSIETVWKKEDKNV